MKEEEIRDTEVLNEYLDMVRRDVADMFDFSSFARIGCPACGSSDHEDRFDKLGFRYVSCRQCATLFVNPRPSFDVLNRFYSDSPSTSFWVNRFFKPFAVARRSRIFRPRAEYAHSLLGSSTALRIGDIGAGFGIFLEELRNFMPGNDYFAIEPSREMADICREKKFETRCECLENIRDMNGGFDFLTAFELVEHLHDPESFVKKIYSLLKPGGRLLLTTLNGMGFDILILWDKSKSVSPPHHLNFFNPSSIGNLLRKTGFSIEEATTPGKLDWDIVERAINSGDFEAGRLWKFLARDGDERSRRELQEWIARNNLSSHMRILARKEG